MGKVIKPKKGLNPLKDKDLITFLRFIRDNPHTVKKGITLDKMELENAKELPKLDLSHHLLKPDGNVHTMPSTGKTHLEHKDCWCQPDLVEDGTIKQYLHKEIQ